MVQEASKAQQLSVVNARGLRNRIKRRSVFRHVRINSRNSIEVLQETHSTENDEIICKVNGQGLSFSPIVLNHDKVEW